MNKKLAFASGVFATTLVLWACSSDDATTSTTDGGPDTGTNETGNNTEGDSAVDAKPDAVNTSDANFDADSINAPEVTIKYGTPGDECPAFTKCESDPTGTWKTTGGCVSSTLFDVGREKCPGFQESNVVIKAKGIITIGAANVSRQAKVTIGAHLVLPKSCSPIADCNVVAVGLKTQQFGAFDTATCVEEGGTNCACDVTKILADNSADTYTKTGGTMTTGAGETYDYCVAAGVLTYRKADSNGDKEPATFTAAP